MLKILGVLLITGGLAAYFQPNWMNGILGNSENDLSASVTTAANRGVNKAETVYAAGYSDSDFGEAFTSPNEGKFAVEEEVVPVGVWADLLQLKFKISFDEQVDDVIFQPKFTELIRSYEGQIIEVEGFIIPHNIASNAMGNVDESGEQFMFSAFPLASCFFCGGAGIESVMEAFPKKPTNYTEKKITLRGRLELNDKDFLKLPYMLKDAVVIPNN